jgi:hypothetical protein
MPRAKITSVNWTYGCELELGDVSRDIVIPLQYGKWEYAETDIVNILPPYRHVACDPLGLEPPMGGEINTVPTIGWKSQIKLIEELLKWLITEGQSPTTNCISHTHVHIHIPRLVRDIELLKKLTRYIMENQVKSVDSCLQFDSRQMSAKLGAGYLKLDCGRLMPDWMGENIINMANSFDDFIRIQCCGKDGVSRGRPFRYAINTYCLKHTQTIEFRLFRSSLDLLELSDCFRFVEQFMLAALNDGPSVDELLRVGYKFPPFRYSLPEVEGWLKTKWDKSRGEKKREFIPVT